jgi:hypothetical protein
VGSIEVNGITLDVERRGHGPSGVFISGAIGGAGHWTAGPLDLGR